MAGRAPVDRDATCGAAWQGRHTLREVRAHDPQREEVEAFIRGVYRSRFGARLRDFAPVLVALREPGGQLVAAAGYRDAAAGPLFLERYLSAPVHQVLRSPGAQETPRQRIVEVGHLAATRAGEGRRLIQMLGPLLASEGFEWVVSTLTQELRHLFLRLGVAPLALGVADPDTLGHEACDWGSYYDHRPVVLAGRIDAAMQALARREVAA